MTCSDCATSILTVEAGGPGKSDLEQSPSKQSTNLPWLVQAAADGSERSAHHVGHKAVQQGAESRAQDDGQRVGEPGGQTARGMLLTRTVQRRCRRRGHGGALRGRTEGVCIDERRRGDDSRFVASVSHCSRSSNFVVEAAVKMERSFNFCTERVGDVLAFLHRPPPPLLTLSRTFHRSCPNITRTLPDFTITNHSFWCPWIVVISSLSLSLPPSHLDSSCMQCYGLSMHWPWILRSCDSHDPLGESPATTSL